MWLYCKQDGSRRKWSQSHQRNKTRLNCCGSGATSAKTETSTTLALPSRELHSSPATEGGELGGGGSPVGAGAGFSDVNLGGSPPRLSWAYRNSPPRHTVLRKPQAEPQLMGRKHTRRCRCQHAPLCRVPTADPGETQRGPFCFHAPSFPADSGVNLTKTVCELSVSLAWRVPERRGDWGVGVVRSDEAAGLRLICKSWLSSTPLSRPLFSFLENLKT